MLICTQCMCKCTNSYNNSKIHDLPAPVVVALVAAEGNFDNKRVFEPIIEQEELQARNRKMMFMNSNCSYQTFKKIVKASGNESYGSYFFLFFDFIQHLLSAANLFSVLLRLGKVSISGYKIEQA